VSSIFTTGLEGFLLTEKLKKKKKAINWLRRKLADRFAFLFSE